MSDVEENGFPRIQRSFFVNGDHVVFRGNTADEFVEAIEGVAEHAERIEKGVNAVKQVAVASGVFTGDSANGGSRSGGNATRAKDAPPPSANGAPLCDKHNEPMKDLGDRGYRHRWYCPRPRDEAQGCKPKD